MSLWFCNTEKHIIQQNNICLELFKTPKMIQGGMSQPLFDGMFQPSIFEHDLKRFLTLQQTADGGSFSSFGSKNICCRNGKQTSYTQVEDFSHSWASVTPLSNPRPWPCQNDGSLPWSA